MVKRRGEGKWERGERGKAKKLVKEYGKEPRKKGKDGKKYGKKKRGNGKDGKENSKWRRGRKITKNRGERSKSKGGKGKK